MADDTTVGRAGGRVGPRRRGIRTNKKGGPVRTALLSVAVSEPA